jgi:hypothetical protein
VLYLPVVKYENYHNDWDPRTADFTSTFNFNYSKEQVLLLSGLAEHIMVENTEGIKKAIRLCIERKRKGKSQYIFK